MATPLCCVQWLVIPTSQKDVKFWGKLYFTTLNYAPNYTLHPKLFECTFCTLNYHTLHSKLSHFAPWCNFAIMFDRMLLHVTSTCILFRWNKLKRLKHPFSKSIKTKANFFQISLLVSRACQPLPQIQMWKKNWFLF